MDAVHGHPRVLTHLDDGTITGSVVDDARSAGSRRGHPLDHRLELRIAAEGAAAAPVARDDGQ